MEREQVWQGRVAQWRASGLSQRAYAIEQGYPIRQVGYWVRRLAAAQAVPALLPLRLAPTVGTTAPIHLGSENGWTLALPGDVPVSWLCRAAPFLIRFGALQFGGLAGWPRSD